MAVRHSTRQVPDDARHWSVCLWVERQLQFARLPMADIAYCSTNLGTGRVRYYARARPHRDRRQHRDATGRPASSTSGSRIWSGAGRSTSGPSCSGSARTGMTSWTSARRRTGPGRPRRPSGAGPGSSMDAVQQFDHVGAGPVPYWGVSLGCGLGVPVRCRRAPGPRGSAGLGRGAGIG